MGLVKYALKYRISFYVLSILTLFLGGSAIVAMPKDVLPVVNIPVVSIIWTYAGQPTMTAALGVARHGPIGSGGAGARDPGSLPLAAGALRPRRAVRLPATARWQARIVRRLWRLAKLRLQHRNAVQQRQDQRVFLRRGQAREIGPRHE
jgi:hypothetical protein